MLDKAETNSQSKQRSCSYQDLIKDPEHSPGKEEKKETEDKGVRKLYSNNHTNMPKLLLIRRQGQTPTINLIE